MFSQAGLVAARFFFTFRKISALRPSHRYKIKKYAFKCSPLHLCNFIN
nr:MAG TPA: hypothetical protein [Bacteriophage sp.]